MKVSLIAACTPEYVIGKDGKMPWHLPPDLKHFQQLTMGHPVIMGRKTYESIGRPLKGRKNIVLSRNAALTIEGVSVVTSFVDALKLAQDTSPTDRVFVIGGANVYQQALSIADTLHLTVIFQKYEGDTFFPKFDLSEWELVSEIYHEAEGKNPAFSFYKYERKGSNTNE
jgi:dihydrofolate reductase